MLPKMTRPINLSVQNVDFSVPQAVYEGTYALGAIVNNALAVRHVVRSDNDLKARLKQHVNKYAAFAFAIASSPMDAFRMECELYHGVKPPDNKIHPQPPESMDWKCPACTILG